MEIDFFLTHLSNIKLDKQMEYESIQPILQWISEHPSWSGFIVFLISLSESLAIVGLFVPGVVMMTAIGAMMGSGVLPFWETLTWAILGAVAGDGISYWLGYHYHEHLRDFWPFSRFPGLLKRGENFFKEHGGKSIIFGRFVGPVRPMIPVIAGMMDMTPKRFLLFNVLSAIAWAPLYSLPGILIGASLGTLSPEVARRIVLLILLLLLVLWLLYVFLLKLGGWIGGNISRTLTKVWKHWQISNRLPWLHKALATAQGSEEGQLGAALLFVLSFTSFIYITVNVMNWEGISLWNEPVYQALRALYVDNVVDIVTFVTGLAQPLILLPAAAAVGLWLLWRKRYIAMLCWLGTIGVTEAIGFSLRGVVAMQRPEGLMKLTQEYSYPSGHALTATLVYGLAAAFIQHKVLPAHRWIAWAISVPLILILSFTRLYIGMHWFTDVLGGIMLGVAGVALGILIFRRLEHKIPPIRDILIPGLLVLTLTMTYYTFMIYPKIRTNVVRQWSAQQFNSEEWWKDQSDTYEFYRTGALKRIATYFDIQWLGSLEKIKTILEQEGWKPVPQLNFQSGLTLLASHPAPESIPVMPKFHRDRLPVLVVSKAVNDKERLLLQLWHSDYISENGKPLWLGTLRLESLKHPIPFVSLYQESENQGELLQQLINKLKKSGISYSIHPSTVSNIKNILLIRSE